jgi:hypothetical protein
VGAFEGWKGQSDRREALMNGVVVAIRAAMLVPVGSALRLSDYDSLPEEARGRLRGPYYCCLQDVLYGFSLMAEDLGPGSLAVTGDRNDELAEDARKLHAALRGAGGWFEVLADGLEYADMRAAYGLQAADLLAYEMTKELANQDLRPEDRMRWPLDQIISDERLPVGKALKYNTLEMLRAQADGNWMARRRELILEELDESMRLLRDKGGPFKAGIQRMRRKAPPA